MSKKKDFPLIVLKALEPFVNMKGDKFNIVDPGDGLLKAIDVDPSSNFYFIIERYQRTTNGFQLLMNRRPSNRSHPDGMRNWIEISSLASQFQEWIKLLEEYETTNSFFDDPILKSFQEEFYSEFEIIEENADKVPFSTKQILLLDTYLEKVNEELDKHITEQNKSDIQVIRDEILILRDNLTVKSKKWVVTQLSKIWARIAKQGSKFLKEFLSESKKEIIKAGVKGLIDFVKENGPESLQ